MTASVRVGVVVGNPRPASRTLSAATYLAGELGRGWGGGRPDLVVDLATYGGRLLDWGDAEVTGVVEAVGAVDLLVVACPTYKATYTGLLKVFLDRFEARPRQALAVPLMLGGGPAHALAPELSLRPVLAELGFHTLRGLYVLDQRHDDPAAYADWLAQVRPLVETVARTTAGAAP